MKKLLTLVSVLSLNLVTFAQINPTKNDPEAKKLLDAVSTKFKTYASPQAYFTYKVENAQGKALSTKKGSVTMKGSKFRVSMDGMEIFSDGKTVWNYDKSDNEVTVSNVNEGGSGMNPQKMFTNFYDKDFYYKMNGTKKEGGKTLAEVELTPTDKTRPYHKVYVLVDKASNTIYSARFLEKSGGRYSYTINSLKTTSTTADAEFLFNKTKFPGVEVVDIR
ncbi:MAG TPA: outer membrane lipoprotein carrier protein LolA [Flavisolibacter sp.]|jgi:outer membrane lipoprotein-sorting protein|nr:outer membrane lipoprotein carrier protein LolA [Flavisolibacter sp.]